MVSHIEVWSKVNGKENSKKYITKGIYSINIQSIPVVIFSILAGLLVIAGFILEIIFIIIATSKANQGEPYKYPLTIKFLN